LVGAAQVLDSQPHINGFLKGHWLFRQIRFSIQNSAQLRVIKNLGPQFPVAFREGKQAAELKRIAAEAATQPLPPSIPSESTVLGYTVRRHKPVQTGEEQRAKEDVAHKVMAQAMKQAR
jgi:hypothetical protein